jgi:A/G-specific adenine glycosylase
MRSEAPVVQRRKATRAQPRPSPRPAFEAAPRARASLRRALLRWYRANARDLPWRRRRDPWAIWVSEVMLQQTQVATALRYYPSFLQRFPTPAALAGSREEEVLAAWSGLGYYRRARQLRIAAQEVVREHAGRVPDDPEAFGSLSGVGRYTKGAVLSMGFGQPHAVLDGNVARVFSRLFVLKAAARDPRGARALWAQAEALVPARGAGDWNQALMELGATVCTPRSPRCGACPLRGQCRAFALRRVAEFPPVVSRRATVRLRRAVALIERNGRVLMTQRRGALLDGLWEPPGVDLEPREHAHSKLADELSRFGVKADLAFTGQILKHTITHRSIEVEVWRGTTATALARAHSARGLTRYVDARHGSAPLTALAKKLASTLAGSKTA